MNLLEELKNAKLEEVDESIIKDGNYTLYCFAVDGTTGLVRVAHCVANLEEYYNGNHDVVNWRGMDNIKSFSDLNRAFDCYRDYSILLFEGSAYVYDNSKKELIGYC